MWFQCGSSEVYNGGIFGGLSLECCVDQILEVRTDNGDGDSMTPGFIVE